MKKLAVQLIKELTSLSDTIPTDFKGFFAKSSGLFWKNSDGTEKQIATTDHNHTLASLSERSYNSLTDKPTIPSAQVQTDWNATTGLGVLLNKPTSLPANGGNADTVDGFHASAFAKIDTAFTAHMNIPNNNADCAVFVLNSYIYSTNIGTFISNDYSLPQGTTSAILILQPGIYEIDTIIDFNTHAIRGIIGLCPDSTIINVADINLIINLELIENLTIKLADSTGTLIRNDYLPKAEARHLKIKHVGASQDDIEAICFNNYTLIDDCSIEGVIGICESSRNISNINHTCNNIVNYSGTPVFKKSTNINNFNGFYYRPIITIDYCKNISNAIIEYSFSDDLYTSSIVGSTNLSNIKVYNSDIGFLECENINNSSVKTDTSNNTTSGFSNCFNISNCIASAYIGFGGCSKITTSQTIGCYIGFYSSNKITLSKVYSSLFRGFDSCVGMTQNESESYNSCFADMGGTYPVADTPNGGFNS